MAGLVVLFLLMMVKSGISQSNNNNNSISTPLAWYCDRVPPISRSNFFSNLNSTVAQLRTTLSSNNDVYYAKAESLSNGDSVYGDALCRNYLSTAQCVACFDVAVSALSGCTSSNGAHVYLVDCFFRYQNIKGFYDNPSATSESDVKVSLGICGNQLASQPAIFNQTVEQFLSDMQVAAPRTSNFYAASTKQVSIDNTTVYAISQCIPNTSRTVCENCLSNAFDNLHSCLPRTNGMAVELGCFARYTETPLFQDNQTTDITLLLRSGSSRNVGKIGAVIGVGLLCLIVALSLWCRRWKRLRAARTDSSELQRAINYSYKDLQLATNNFSDEYKVGKGGFGEVFKAIVDNQNVVAVKKLRAGHIRAKNEFDNEVKLISDVRHRNLVRLLGWSSEGPELLLVLEYMPQGSLDKFLWGEKRGTLNWKQRFDIIFGIARGLAHLHHEFHVKIIHRDIKSANILLDDDFQPKIADFGLAKLYPEDRTHVSTKFAGTMGYAAPEYVTCGKLSERVDTYSFGIVILEIVSGRRCNDLNSDEDHLLEHAWKSYENDMHMNLIDETLNLNEYEDEHVMKVIEIGLTCTQSPAKLRPTMSEAVSMLSSGQSFRQRQLTRRSFR